MFLLFINLQPVGLFIQKTNVHIMRHGRIDLIMDPGSKMEARTSYMAAYSPPQSPEVRLYGMCFDLMNFWTVKPWQMFQRNQTHISSTETCAFLILFNG